MKSIIKLKDRFLAGAAGFALVGGGLMTAAPASASEIVTPADAPAPGQSQSVAPAPAPGSQSPLPAAEQEMLEKLVAATDLDNQVFDAAAALDSGVGDSAVADYAAAYQTQGSVVNLPAVTQAEASEAGLSIAAAASSCTGARGYTGFWGWGWQTALNSCDTDLLMAAIAGTGGVTAGVGGVIAAATGPGAPVGGIVAAAGGLIAAGSGIILICKNASYDYKAIYLNVFVTGGVGCWGQ